MTRARAFRQLEGEKIRGMLAVEAAVREVKEAVADEARQLRAELAHAQRDNGKHVVQIRQMERQLAAGARIWMQAAAVVAAAALLHWSLRCLGLLAGQERMQGLRCGTGARVPGGAAMVTPVVPRVPCRTVAMLREAWRVRGGDLGTLRRLGSFDLPARPRRVS